MSLRHVSDEDLLDKCLSTEIFLASEIGLSTADKIMFKRSIVRMRKEIFKRNLTPKTANIDGTSD